jgi:hypothetical protein
MKIQDENEDEEERIGKVFSKIVQEILTRP